MSLFVITVSLGNTSASVFIERNKRQVDCWFDTNSITIAESEAIHIAENLIGGASEYGINKSVQVFRFGKEYKTIERTAK